MEFNWPLAHIISSVQRAPSKSQKDGQPHLSGPTTVPSGSGLTDIIIPQFTSDNHCTCFVGFLFTLMIIVTKLQSWYSEPSKGIPNHKQESQTNFHVLVMPAKYKPKFELDGFEAAPLTISSFSFLFFLSYDLLTI